MTVTTRRDRRERERIRQQRRRGGAGSPAPRRRIGQGWIVLGVTVAFVALILAGRAFGVFDPPPPPLDVNAQEFDTAGQTIGTKVEDIGSAHIPQGQKATYNSIPPTSGEMWPAPAPWGIKDTTLANETTIHNLEHGGVVVAYNNLTTAEVDQLKSIVRQLQSSGFPKVILQPYPDLRDAKVALTAWTWLYKLPTVDQTQIVRFFRAHYAPVEAPERNAG